MQPPATRIDYRAAKVKLARRVREVREELYGEDGGRRLADAMFLPYETWMNYESGVVMPSVVILRFIELTGTNPLWLLRGQGDKFNG